MIDEEKLGPRIFAMASKAGDGDHGENHLAAIILVVNGDCGQRIVFCVEAVKGANGGNAAQRKAWKDSNPHPTTPSAEGEASRGRPQDASTPIQQQQQQQQQQQHAKGKGRQKSILTLYPSFVLGVPANGLARLLAPKPGPLCGKKLEVSIEEGGRALTFIGHPTAVSTKHTQQQQQEGAEQFDDSGSSPIHRMSAALLPGSHEALTTFTLVFVLSGHCRYVSRFGHVSSAMSDAWNYEQQRCGFISREVQRFRDEVQQPIDGGPSSEPCIYCGSVPADRVNGCEVCMSNYREGGGRGMGHEGMLDEEVRVLYEGLSNSGVAHVTVNGWLRVDCRIRSAEDTGVLPMSSQTLLLLRPKDHILSHLPPDYSPDLALLISVADPLKPFRKLSIDLKIPLERLYSLSLHLVSWGKGRIVQCVNKNSVYLVSPFAEFHKENKVSLSFARFLHRGEETQARPDRPSLDQLRDALLIFSQAKPLQEHHRAEEDRLIAKLNLSRWDRISPQNAALIRSRKTDISRMAAWLLEHDLIVQHQTFIELYAPPSSNSSQPPPSPSPSPPPQPSSSMTPASSTRKLMPPVPPQLSSNIPPSPSSPSAISESTPILPPLHLWRVQAFAMGLHPRLGAPPSSVSLISPQQSHHQQHPAPSISQPQGTASSIYGGSGAHVSPTPSHGSSSAGHHLLLSNPAARRPLELIFDYVKGGTGSVPAVSHMSGGRDRAWVEAAGNPEESREAMRREMLVRAWHRHMDAGLAAVKLSHTAQHRLWERLKLLLPYLDGRHTLEEISALSKVRSSDVSAIASLCPDFLLCVRCAV